MTFLLNHLMVTSHGLRMYRTSRCTRRNRWSTPFQSLDVPVIKHGNGTSQYKSHFIYFTEEKTQSIHIVYIKMRDSFRCHVWLPDGQCRCWISSRPPMNLCIILVRSCQKLNIALSGAPALPSWSDKLCRSILKPVDLKENLQESMVYLGFTPLNPGVPCTISTISGHHPSSRMSLSWKSAFFFVDYPKPNHPIPCSPVIFHSWHQSTKPGLPLLQGFAHWKKDDVP